MSEQDAFERLQLQRRVHEDGTISWHNSANQLHRVNGPALIHPNGFQEWFQNGQLHRVNGPAMVGIEGTQLWIQNGLLHRTDGPAVDSPGEKSWYLNGKQLTEEEFHERTRCI